jgi:extracellular factor (EF) 3-hydroxypalmitic acid methyl ester biosynthesis protein
MHDRSVDTSCGDTRSPAAAAELNELRTAALGLVSVPATLAPRRLHHLVMAAFHRIMDAAFAAEAAGASREQRREATAAARKLCARFSPFVAHAQTWPRGYPGDFEIIERLLDGGAEAGTDTLAYAFESVVLRLPIVVQHRTKVQWQADLVRRRLVVCPSLKVLSIGCGGCRDLLHLDPEELSRLTVVLNDLDPEALALSTGRLRPLVRSAETIVGNAYRRVAQLRAAGPYDVILVGGLLDYLPDRWARGLLGKALGMLAPAGVLGCTNIAAEHVWRPLLELLADWPLIERTEADMARLFPSPGTSVHATLDPTRLTWLVTATAS